MNETTTTGGERKLAKDFERRAAEAWDQRYKHAKAAKEWARIAAKEENPHRRQLYETLASWMVAYADADAEHERQFSETAAAIRATISPPVASP